MTYFERQLKQFFTAYLEWAEADAPEDTKILLSRKSGLCSNAFFFHGEEFSADFSEFLSEKFPGNSTTPFKRHKIYYDEFYDQDFHKNPLRLQFIRDTLKELSEI